MPLAGTARFELADAGAKILCLTSWRCPCVKRPRFYSISGAPFLPTSSGSHHANSPKVHSTSRLFRAARKEKEMKSEAIGPWSRQRVLNPQPPAWRAGALPIELCRHIKQPDPKTGLLTFRNSPPSDWAHLQETRCVPHDSPSVPSHFVDRLHGGECSRSHRKQRRKPTARTELKDDIAHSKQILYSFNSKHRHCHLSSDFWNRSDSNQRPLDHTIVGAGALPTELLFRI